MMATPKKVIERRYIPWWSWPVAVVALAALVWLNFIYTKPVVYGPFPLPVEQRITALGERVAELERNQALCPWNGE